MLVKNNSELSLALKYQVRLISEESASAPSSNFVGAELEMSGLEYSRLHQLPPNGSTVK